MMGICEGDRSGRAAGRTAFGGTEGYDEPRVVRLLHPLGGAITDNREPSLLWVEYIEAVQGG